METNPQAQLINMKPDTTTLIINGNGKPIKWPTIITCIIFVITGQSIARLLETVHHHHNIYQQWRSQLKLLPGSFNSTVYLSLHDGIWSQPLLQVIGFPLLILPFFLLSSKKHNQLLTTSNRSSLSILYICTGVIMVVQAKLYVKGKLELPFTRFLLLDGTRLYFTPILASIVNKIKYNIWIVISLIYTLAITTLSSYIGGEWSAILAAFTFSFLLCNMQRIFDIIISSRNEKPIFADVLALLIFSSLFATVAAVFISGENHDLRREMDSFSKGKIVYVMTMVGQAAAWQIYWVGVVGLVVYSESVVTSNVISLSAYPILKIWFCNYEDDEFDGFLGAALALSATAVASCLYKTKYKHIRGSGNSKRHRLFLILVFLFVHHFYVSELLNSDPYISAPTGFEYF